MNNNEKIVELAKKKAELFKQAEGEQGERIRGPYKVQHGAIYRIKRRDDGYEEIPLCNFVARIVEETIRDNGLERTMTFTIEGELADGRPLPRIEVAADKFGSLNWITAEWGTRAVVYAGNGVKEHLRTAIQILSLQMGDIPRRTVYAHLGWRKIGSKWLYLHNGGAIGDTADECVEVNACAQLANYILPTLPEGEQLKNAIRASMRLLAVTRPEIAYPLLAAIYRAPLGEALPIDFSLFISGPTGVQKSELSAIAQAHWGAGFNGKNLPASWSSTANALEKLAFLAKDAILVIDDFVLHGGVGDIQKLYKEADRILRAQGNIAGRTRMNADGSLKAAYHPRGLIISTGEDVPVGQSLTARMVILEINHGDVDLQVLTELQNYAAGGILAQAMAGYIAWLAPRLDELKQKLSQRKNEFRNLIRQSGKVVAHDRTPDNLASLLVGLDMFLKYAVERGAITADDAKELFSQGFKTLLEIGEAQAQYQRSEDPVERFIELINAAITTGIAHVADAQTGGMPDDGRLWGWRDRDKSNGTLIGWIDGDDLLLQPDTAFKTAQIMAREQGMALPITRRTLWRRLQQKGLLVSFEEGRWTQRWYIQGVQKRVIHLHKDLLMERASQPADDEVAI